MFPDAKQIWANAHAMVAGIVVGAAAMMSAVDEGLAGVVNAGVGYDEIAFSAAVSPQRSLTASKGRLFPVFWNSRPKLDGIFWATNC